MHHKKENEFVLNKEEIARFQKTNHAIVECFKQKLKTWFHPRLNAGRFSHDPLFFSNASPVSSP